MSTHVHKISTHKWPENLNHMHVPETYRSCPSGPCIHILYLNKILEINGSAFCGNYKTDQIKELMNFSSLKQNS
jgi:hypothetical protein